MSRRLGRSSPGLRSDADFQPSYQPLQVTARFGDRPLAAPAIASPEKATWSATEACRGRSRGRCAADGVLRGMGPTYTPSSEGGSRPRQQQGPGDASQALVGRDGVAWGLSPAGLLYGLHDQRSRLSADRAAASANPVRDGRAARCLHGPVSVCPAPGWHTVGLGERGQAHQASVALGCQQESPRLGIGGLTSSGTIHGYPTRMTPRADSSKIPVKGNRAHECYFFGI
jgi:hypothetical protein